MRRPVHVLRSRTMVLILGERAGLFNASEALREVSELRTFTEHELGQLRKAASGVLVTFSGHDPDSIRLMQSMLTEAARRLVLADREARRLWDSPEIVDRARAINAEAIDNPGRASDETRKRWKDWRNRAAPTGSGSTGASIRAGPRRRSIRR